MNISAFGISGEKYYTSYAKKTEKVRDALFTTMEEEREEEKLRERDAPSAKEDEQEESGGTHSQIVVKPDGTRVLMITTMVCGMETTASLKLSDSRSMTASVVDDYKRKHPEDAAHVNSQVNAGKRVLLKNGADKISREDMTMQEYQSFIMGLLNSIPFDASRVGDKEFIDITDAGWEQMKNDSEYEAWVLGYTVENRSVRNPFAGWPGVSPNLCVEHFGASIEEHLGQSVPMNSSAAGNSDEDDEESWWDKRHKRMKKLLEEQVKEAQIKRQATQVWERQEYHRAALESRQRMTAFLADHDRTTVGTGTSLEGQSLPQTVAAAIAAYNSALFMGVE